jgi:uncharacterized protein (DUF58 family)
MDRRVGGRMAGDHRGLGRGNGIELDRIRPYEPGDDVRKIDWNCDGTLARPTSARTCRNGSSPPGCSSTTPRRCTSGRPERRKADVAGGRGTRRRPVRGPTRQSPRHRHLRGEKTDVMPPAGGRRGMLGLIRALETEAARRRATGATSPANALSLVAATRSTPGVVVIASDFRGPRDWVGPLTNVAGRHAVIALEITDPREDALVDVGELTLIDPETGQTLRIDTSDRKLRRAFDDAASADRADLASTFARLNVRHLRLTTDGPWLPALARGFSRTPDRTGRPA